jgi:hypothetical protein
LQWLLKKLSLQEEQVSKGWWSGSSDREPVEQAWGGEFTPRYCQKSTTTKKEEQVNSEQS